MQILGHERILELLPRLQAQAFLFTGPESVGRRQVARWFTAGLNCEKGFPPCGQCASCRPEAHPDYLEIAPEYETKTGRKARAPQIRLEQIAPRDGTETQSLLDWIVTYPRFKSKVAVIDGAHFLGEAAANALLKVLEEPPSFARIILIAPSRELVLPTLVSRSLEVSFAPVPQALLQTLTTDPRCWRLPRGLRARYAGPWNTLPSLVGWLAVPRVCWKPCSPGPLKPSRPSSCSANWRRPFPTWVDNSSSALL